VDLCNHLEIMSLDKIMWEIGNIKLYAGGRGAFGWSIQASILPQRQANI
jgi:hypothetical protein